MTDYNYLITELVNYGCNNNLVDELDRMLTINRLVELLDLDEYIEPEEEIVPRELHFILEDFIALKGDLTNAEKDLYDTKLMGILTPPPSFVIRMFEAIKDDSVKEATDWYYSFS